MKTLIATPDPPEPERVTWMTLGENITTTACNMQSVTWDGVGVAVTTTTSTSY